MVILFAFAGTLSLIFGFLGLIHPRITVKPPFARTRKRLVAFYGVLFVGSMVAAIALQAPPSALQAPPSALQAPPSTIEPEARRMAKIATLDARARALPANNAVANMATYAQLLSLDPENGRYQEKVEHYRPLAEEQERVLAAVAAERQKEQARIQAEKGRELREAQAEHARELGKIRAINAAREKKHGPVPTKSDWDGSVAAVKAYIKAVAKDPDSVKYEAWGPVEYSEERGWAVQCDWRAKNSFGGYGREINTFYIRFGQVADVE